MDSRFSGVSTAVAACLLALTACSPQPGVRNVLFIVADDLREFSDSGHTVETPYIDRLARMGRRFERAYAQIPKCSPSRASVMTGRRPERLGIYGNGEPVRESIGGAEPLQELFRSHGYFTARVGKVYHSRFEHQFRWDLAEDAGDRAPDTEDDGLKWGPTDNEDDEEPDGRTARRVAELLREHHDQRFFIAAGFISSHSPLRAPRKYFDLYPPESLPQPIEGSGEGPLPRLARGPAVDLRVTPGQRTAALQAYYACVAFLDTQLGVILETMDELDLWSNTVVVFWSDQGFHLGEHGGMWRKTTLFEESTRVPLILVAPGMGLTGAETRHIVELIDIYPTLIELARLRAPGGLDGISLVPLLIDPSHAVKNEAFSVVQRPSGLGRTVRTERYRYTEWPDGSVELFDHSIDPRESINLAHSPAHSKTVSDLRARLHNRI